MLRSSQELNKDGGSIFVLREKHLNLFNNNKKLFLEWPRLTSETIGTGPMNTCKSVGTRKSVFENMTKLTRGRRNSRVV